MFVSRKEGKIFVRKGFEPVFDAPVTFEQPDQPLGTHVLHRARLQRRQLQPALDGDDGADRAHAGEGREDRKEGQEPVQVAAPASERGRQPPPMRSTASPSRRTRSTASPGLMSAGASLIISDQGLGPETGKGTDFIVLTR